MRVDAVVFDLWNTLVTWPLEESAELRVRWSDLLGCTQDRFDELWYGDGAYERRETSPLRPVLEQLCVSLGSDADLDELLESRVELTRRSLVPSPEVLDTLRAIRSRGPSLGLISNCSEDVALGWADTPLASCFDVALFSASVGCMKPDRRIYELASTGLGVAPERCLFVGDGANDELRGASAAGMRAVLLQPGEEPAWPEVSSWSGERVASVAEVLALVE